jgi:hypothetical protein
MIWNEHDACTNLRSHKLRTKVNINRYMRWHTTFSHNGTSVLGGNVVSIPTENSFQPNHSMNMQNKRNLPTCFQAHQTCVHDTAPKTTPLDWQCIRSCSHSSHLPRRRGRIDPYITTQMNGTHTIACRMSDEIKI